MSLKDEEPELATIMVAMAVVAILVLLSILVASSNCS